MGAVWVWASSQSYNTAKFCFVHLRRGARAAASTHAAAAPGATCWICCPVWYNVWDGCFRFGASFILVPPPWVTDDCFASWPKCLLVPRGEGRDLGSFSSKSVHPTIPRKTRAAESKLLPSPPSINHHTAERGRAADRASPVVSSYDGHSRCGPRQRRLRQPPGTQRPRGAAGLRGGGQDRRHGGIALDPGHAAPGRARPVPGGALVAVCAPTRSGTSPCFWC